MSMLHPRPSASVLVALPFIVALLVSGCGAQGSASSTPQAATSPLSAAPTGETAKGASGASRVRFAEVTLAVPAGNAGGSISHGLLLRMPRGWRAEVWTRVPDARLEAWTPQGDLLVSKPDDGQVMELIPHRDRATPPSRRVLVSGLDEPQGLAFARLGGHEVLYVAEENEIDRYQWQDGHVGVRRVVVPDLPDTAPAGSDNHTLKNVVVGEGGRVYVDIASGSNASPPTGSDPPRASVISYTATGTDMRVVATGVRNGDGLSFAPDGTLWTAVNERDQITYPFHGSYGSSGDAYGQAIQAYVNNHPPDQIARLTPGRNLGWPYCDPDPDVHPGQAGTGFTYANLPFTADQETNPDGNVLDCAGLAPINRGLPAHSAPLGFHFLEGSRLPAPWSAGATVAVHGSWDRQPPRAPGVLWLPWNKATRTLGPATTLISGFQNAAGNRWGRPVDAVSGPDRALYVSDDTAGAIYRIVP